MKTGLIRPEVDVIGHWGIKGFTNLLRLFNTSQTEELLKFAEIIDDTLYQSIHKIRKERTCCAKILYFTRSQLIKNPFFGCKII